MNKIVESSFSTRRIGKDLDRHIAELNNCFYATGLSETLKVHSALSHIEHSLLFLGCSGLGLWSEQAGESIDCEFLKFRSRYQINNLDDESYGERLKKAVTEFSSRHL